MFRFTDLTADENAESKSPIPPVKNCVTPSFSTDKVIVSIKSLFISQHKLLWTKPLQTKLIYIPFNDLIAFLYSIITIYSLFSSQIGNLIVRIHDTIIV